MNSAKRVLNNRDDDRIVVEDPTLDESDSERPHKTKSPNHKAAQALKSVETGKLHHFEKLLDLTETNRKQSTPPATFREHSNKNSKILSNKTTLPERSNINQEDSLRSQPPITFSPLKRNSVTEPVTVGQSSLDPITLYYKAQQEKLDQEKKIFEAEKLAFEEKLHHSQDKTIKTAPSSDRVINDPLLNNHNENHSHESPTSKKLDHDSYTKPLNREQTIKSVKEKVKAMNEIVGCRGKGPVDFVFILEQIKMIEGVSFLDFCQLSPKFVSEIVESHGPYPHEPCEMYTDASKYGIGCVITQRQKKGTQSSKKVNVPLIFDSMLLSSTQKNYGTYKRELFAMVHFGTKYAHMFKIHDKASIFYTDHEPLVHFIHSPYTEGIYARWAIFLRSLNVEIKWISRKRNAVADALSQTVFQTDAQTISPNLVLLLKKINN